MKGIQYLVDDSGDKTAVLIDLKKYNELWEDFYGSVLRGIGLLNLVTHLTR